KGQRGERYKVVHHGLHYGCAVSPSAKKGDPTLCHFPRDRRQRLDGAPGLRPPDARETRTTMSTTTACVRGKFAGQEARGVEKKCARAQRENRRHHEWASASPDDLTYDTYRDG